MPDLPPDLHRSLGRKPDNRLADRQRAMRQARIEASEAKKIRSTARWQRLRGLLMSRHPLCADPFGRHREEGRIEPATEVHHIEPIWRRPEMAYCPQNLQPLCRRCHTRLEPKERRSDK